MKNVHPIKNHNGKINVTSGIVFDLLNPTPEMVNINDIATGLAHNSHFNGQSDLIFTVAQHSIEVYTRVNTAFNNPILSMAALLHDAAEAYTGDIIKPIKVMWPGFAQLEEKIIAAIFMKYKLPVKAMKIVKPVDELVQELEFGQFYNNESHFVFLDPEDARTLFLKHFAKARKKLDDFYLQHPEYIPDNSKLQKQ